MKGEINDLFDAITAKLKDFGQRLDYLERLDRPGGGIPGAIGYYIATLNQAGTDPPVINELLNTIGATVTPAYLSAGLYTLTFSPNPFSNPENVIALSTHTPANDDILALSVSSGGDIYMAIYDISTAAGADDSMDNTPLLLIFF